MCRKDNNCRFRWSTSVTDNAALTPYAYKSVSGTSTTIGAGAANTAAILGVYPKSTDKYTAAAMCDSYESDGYGDWYLPSKDELARLYDSKDAVEGFVDNKYWSSSEDSDENAWAQTIDDGNQQRDDKSASLFVRPVRTF